MQCRFAHSKLKKFKHCFQKIENRLSQSAPKNGFVLPSSAPLNLFPKRRRMSARPLGSARALAFYIPIRCFISSYASAPTFGISSLHLPHGRFRAYIKFAPPLNTAAGILCPTPCGPRALPPAFLYLRAYRKASCPCTGLSTLSQAPS